jgi:Uma2 family endonuclease
LLVIKQERKSLLSERGIEGAPDLILEIISPSNSYMDRYEKKEAYQQFGVAEYWIVDPANKTLEIYNGSAWDKPWLYLANEGAVKSTILPTLTFDLKEIF